MPSCVRCSKRPGDRKLTRTTVNYGESWQLCLCADCQKLWDWEIWQWLSTAEEQPIEDLYPACFRCGGYPALDQVEVGYSKRDWYFNLCEEDANDWTKFVWSWLNLAEKVPRPFDWARPVRLTPPAGAVGATKPSSPPPEGPLRSPAPARTPPQESFEGEDFQLGFRAAAQMLEFGLQWPEIHQVLQHPSAVGETDTEGMKRYMSPTLTVFVDETARMVVGLRHEEGFAHAEELSAEALSYRFTMHLLERMALRGISAERVRRLIDDRNKTVLPGNADNPGTLVYRSDDLNVVVHPGSRRVLSTSWHGIETTSVAS